MMQTPLLFALGLTALAACSSAINRVDLVPLQSTLQLRALVGSVLVRTVSLPSYAAEEEVSVQGPEGLITSDGAILWADDPERAATLAVSGHLNDILSASVGPDPWPFAGIPDVTVEVRVTDMLAGNDGVFRLRGQYFIGGDGIEFRRIVRSFDYAVPLPGEGVSGVAAAQSQALLQLSEDIARGLGS